MCWQCPGLKNGVSEMDDAIRIDMLSRHFINILAIESCVCEQVNLHSFKLLAAVAVYSCNTELAAEGSTPECPRRWHVILKPPHGTQNVRC